MQTDTVAVCALSQLIRNDGIRRRRSFAKLILGRHITITFHVSVGFTTWVSALAVPNSQFGPLLPCR